MTATAMIRCTAAGLSIGTQLGSAGVNAAEIDFEISRDERTTRWWSFSPQGASGSVIGFVTMQSDSFTVENPHAERFLQGTSPIHMVVSTQSGVNMRGRRTTKVEYYCNRVRYDLLGGWQTVDWTGVALSGCSFEATLHVSSNLSTHRNAYSKVDKPYEKFPKVEG